MKPWNNQNLSADLRITDAANRFGWYLSRWVQAQGTIRLVATRPDTPCVRLEISLSRDLEIQTVRTVTTEFRDGQATLLAQAIACLITEGKEA